jgi:hypothetical protein
MTRFGKSLPLALLLLVGGIFTGRAQADLLLEFDLGPATRLGAIVSFDVSLTFHGNPATDSINILQLGVTGSAPLLTANDTDYSRFNFVYASSLAPSWSVLNTLADGGGIALIADPGFATVLSPNLDSARLGVLSVDTTGLANGAYTVSLTGGPPGLNTDASGTIAGQSVASFSDASIADPNLVTVDFGQPGGVTFEQGVITVPEPSGVALFAAGALVLASMMWKGRHSAV